MSAPWARAPTLLALTPLAPAISLLPGGRWAFPLLAPLTLWPLFASAVRSAAYRRALGAGLVWVALLSAGVVLYTETAPAAAGARILNAEPYRAEMFRWIETGEGKENEPRRFLPEHALHLAAFCLLTVASGGYLGLAMGAALVSYMSYFVGSFALSSGMPVAGALIAWVPWSIVRVIAFVALGAVLARPVLAGWSAAFSARERRWMLAACGGIAVDLVVKTLLAPEYGLLLRGILSGAAR